MSPRGLTWLGGALLVTGWALILLAVIEILPKTFLLAFVAGSLTVIGGGIGLYGLSLWAQALRARDDDER